jgi:GNAT superfamily N-acetyltransferase
VCRPVQPADKAQVLEWDQAIWDGDDYIPYVFDEWLDDAHGRFMAAESQGRVVGVGKLTRLEDDDWWLEGLRVDPSLQSSGVAGQLFDALLKVWQPVGGGGGGALRLMTMHDRYAVHHMCQQRGFYKVGAYVFLRAAVIAPPTGALPPEAAPPFRLVQSDELDEATAYVQNNPAAAWVGPIMDMGWQWGAFRRVYIERARQRGHAWWWRERDGLLVYHTDHDEGEPERPYIETLACPPQAMAELLLDWRRLAAAQGFERVEWTAHAHPDLLAATAAAGFEQSEHGQMWAYALEHTPKIGPASPLSHG